MTGSDPALAAVVQGEMALLDPDVRRSRDEVLAILHPDFVEFGGSGRRWDAGSVADALSGGGARPFVARAVQGARLSDDVVLLTYEAHESDRVSLRSSVWVRHEGTWRILFHQGTPVTGADGPFG